MVRPPVETVVAPVPDMFQQDGGTGGRSQALLQMRLRLQSRAAANVTTIFYLALMVLIRFGWRTKGNTDNEHWKR